MLREERAREKRRQKMTPDLDLHPALFKLRQELRAQLDIPISGWPRVVEGQTIEPHLRAEVDPVHQRRIVIGPVKENALRKRRRFVHPQLRVPIQPMSRDDLILFPWEEPTYALQLEERVTAIENPSASFPQDHNVRPHGSDHEPVFRKFL